MWTECERLRNRVETKMCPESYGPDLHRPDWYDADFYGFRISESLQICTVHITFTFQFCTVQIFADIWFWKSGFALSRFLHSNGFYVDPFDSYFRRFRELTRNINGRFYACTNLRKKNALVNPDGNWNFLFCS